MVDWGGNYPPGAKNDPRAPYNQPDHSHDHEWEGDEFRMQPVFEDGAAIFFERCLYAEGQYGEGWSCEEERSIRFDASYIWYPNGQGAPVPELGEPVPERMEDGLIEVEMAAASDKANITSIDPDPDGGEVRVEYDGWTLVYKP